MRDSSRNIVMFQWVVIAVLVIGAGVGGYILLHRADSLQGQLDDQTGNLASLREQLRQAKISPTPVSTPLPEATKNTATPTPSPTATPKATVSPKATPKL